METVEVLYAFRYMLSLTQSISHIQTLLDPSWLTINTMSDNDTTRIFVSNRRSGKVIHVPQKMASRKARLTYRTKRVAWTQITVEKTAAAHRDHHTRNHPILAISHQ